AHIIGVYDLTRSSARGQGGFGETGIERPAYPHMPLRGNENVQTLAPRSSTDGHGEHEGEKLCARRAPRAEARGLEFGRFSREFKRTNGLAHRNKHFVPHKDGNVNEASVSLQAGNESLRLVATIAAYLAAIVGLCGRSPNCPRLNATYAFNRGYQKCPKSRPCAEAQG